MRVGREPVVRAALKLLDEVGLEGLTLRRIAAALGVQAPTLYWRFRNKQDLVDEMATQVLVDWASELGSVEMPAAWQDLTRLFGHGLRAALLRYRDGARMVSGTRLRDPAIYAKMEAALRVFATAGVAPVEAAICLKTVNDYVIGFTIEQQAVLSPAGERDPAYDLAAREANIDPQLYPLSRSIGAAMFDNFDAGFERGLNLIIAGFAAGLLERGGDGGIRTLDTLSGMTI
jgi:TetR/AcrR family transcriptional regulator, tetracycline repressor protein